MTPSTRTDRLHSWEATTALPLIAAAVVFLFVLTVPVIDPHLAGLPRQVLRVADISIWLLFAVDYTIRMSLAPARLRFIRSHLPDLAMVLLPALRPLRILRLLSLGNVLARRSARSLIADTGLAVTGTAGLVVYLGAVAVLDAERGAPHANINSFGDSLWWACTTITTVGYGDRYPVTAAGRAVAVLLMLIGIALLSVLTAGIAAWFVKQSTDLATSRAAAAVLQQVRQAATEEVAGQRRIDAELEDVLTAMADLNTRLRDIQQRAASS